MLKSSKRGLALKLREIYEILDSISPFSLQESWDNSGLQVGDLDKEIEDIYLCIDIDEELLERLPPRSLLITHHPLLFTPLKSIDYTRYPDKLLVGMIKKEIAHIAMHTNFDKTHLNRYVATHVLQAEDVVCEDFICYFSKEMLFDEALEWVSDAFGLQCPRYVRTKEKIERIALTTGSGGSLIGSVQADLFLTGDLKYHDALKAKIQGLNVIDIGHFESERHFADALAKELKKHEIKAIIAHMINPLDYKGNQ